MDPIVSYLTFFDGSLDPMLGLILWQTQREGNEIIVTFFVMNKYLVTASKMISIHQHYIGCLGLSIDIFLWDGGWDSQKVISITM